MVGDQRDKLDLTLAIISLHLGSFRDQSPSGLNMAQLNSPSFDDDEFCICDVWQLMTLGYSSVKVLQTCPDF